MVTTRRNFTLIYESDSSSIFGCSSSVCLCLKYSLYHYHSFLSFFSKAIRIVDFHSWAPVSRLGHSAETRSESSLSEEKSRNRYLSSIQTQRSLTAPSQRLTPSSIRTQVADCAFTEVKSHPNPQYKSQKVSQSVIRIGQTSGNPKQQIKVYIFFFIFLSACLLTVSSNPTARLITGYRLAELRWHQQEKVIVNDFSKAALPYDTILKGGSNSAKQKIFQQILIVSQPFFEGSTDNRICYLFLLERNGAVQVYFDV